MKRIVWIVSIMVGVALFSGCSAREVKTSDQEYEQLKKDMERISAARDALESRNKDLLKDLSDKDILLASLQDEIEQGKVRITELKEQLTVSFVETLFFRSGSAKLTGEGRATLDRVADALRHMGDKQISVEGHADSKPIGPNLKDKYASNWELSAARAVRVARYLAEKAELPPDRLSATGYSNYRPAGPNDTKDERAKNRRIEILLTPMDRNIVPMEGTGAGDTL